MANITPTVAGNANILLNKVIWGPMANGDIGVDFSGTAGTGYQAAEFSDRSVQVKGTFGTGGTVTIQGSNDGGTTWATLNDAFGNALTITSASIKQITEVCEQIRPNITGGDGTTSLTVVLFMKKMPA